MYPDRILRSSLTAVTLAGVRMSLSTPGQQAVAAAVVAMRTAADLTQRQLAARLRRRLLGIVSRIESAMRLPATDHLLPGEAWPHFWQRRVPLPLAPASGRVHPAGGRG